MKNVNKNITVYIDNKKYESTFGKTILDIARENDIYIPTMCYLPKVEPIASCRLCVIELKDNDGMVLSCQAKATDGVVVTTNSSALYKQRQNIMKLYNVNHPLECGVCDKSGECDLQNKSLDFEVEKQTFSLKEQDRPVEDWGFISYDPSLCIMCEKCVQVCNQIVGDESLQISVGGYKSTIINTLENDDNCVECGECMAVCPVGALVDRDFKYRTNAWELDKIPSSCTHCSSGCQLNYEVKNNEIFRVTNDFEYSSLCGAGRFGYDFENKNITKNIINFNKGIEAFKKAKSIIFNSEITNEEAYILQKLKEKYNYKLISPEAKNYQDFLLNYGKTTGKTLYNGDLVKISKSNNIIIFGSRINDDNPMVKYHITMASKKSRARVTYMHPIEDLNMQNIVTQFVKYEAGSEEGVSALLLNFLNQNIELPSNIDNFLKSLDIGNLCAETNIGESELQLMNKNISFRKKTSIIVGEDLYSHPQAKNIAKILGVFEKYLNINVVLIPPTTNALGVALICELDEEEEEYSIGYNKNGSFNLSSLGDGDLDIPALNQQEGTITTINKQIVVLNKSLNYDGYELNDIVKILKIESEETIDFTKYLPKNKGFKDIEFDNLSNFFDKYGEDKRGYFLDRVEVKIDNSIDMISEINSFNGTILYNCNLGNNFSKWTNKTKNLESTPTLFGSNQFAKLLGIENNDKVEYVLNGINFQQIFKISSNLKGTIAINETYNENKNFSYRFNKVNIEKIKGECLNE